MGPKRACEKLKSPYRSMFLLFRAQGQAGLIESIAFDKFYGREASTKSILVGDNRGQLFETGLEYNSPKDRPLNRVRETTGHRQGA